MLTWSDTPKRLTRRQCGNRKGMALKSRRLELRSSGDQEEEDKAQRWSLLTAFPYPPPKSRLIPTLFSNLYQKRIDRSFPPLSISDGPGKWNLGRLIGSPGRPLLLRSPQGHPREEGLLRRAAAPRPPRVHLPERVRHRRSCPRPGKSKSPPKVPPFSDISTILSVFVLLGSWWARTRRPRASALWSAAGTLECESPVLLFSLVIAETCTWCAGSDAIEAFMLQNLRQPYGFSWRRRQWPRSNAIIYCRQWRRQRRSFFRCLLRIPFSLLPLLALSISSISVFICFVQVHLIGGFDDGPKRVWFIILSSRLRVLFSFDRDDDNIVSLTIVISACCSIRSMPLYRKENRKKKVFLCLYVRN